MYYNGSRALMNSFQTVSIIIIKFSEDKESMLLLASFVVYIYSLFYIAARGTRYIERTLYIQQLRRA